MYPSFGVQYTLLAALVTIGHASIMVESIDGSIIPWNPFVRRQGGNDIAVRLTNNNDLAYLATVVMGTPQQQVPMAAALSQNFISVASPAAGVNSASYYNPTLSSSFVPTNEVTTVDTINGGSFTGRFAGETCALKSATSAANFVYNASVVLTDSSANSVLYPPGANGILGYGVNVPTSVVAKNASLVNTFLPDGFLHAICGIELNHKDDPVPDGILTMGAVDQSAFSGDFTNALVPAGSPVSWAVPVDKITYAADSFSHDIPGLLASIDISHPGIQLSTAMAQQIYSSINGSKPISDTDWAVPCDAKFCVTLTFNGKPFTISERDTIKKLSDGTCHGAVTGGAHKLAAIGAPFLRNYYTQFGANRTKASETPTFFVGFAAKKLREK